MKNGKSNLDRLNEIAEIIENVDNRAMTHDVVTPTLQEMTHAEITKIYHLAKVKKTKPKKKRHARTRAY